MLKITVPPIQKGSLFSIADALSPLAALLGISSFIGVAVIGFGKSGSWMSDFNWYYAGGTCLLSGGNMYDLECFGPLIKELSGVEALAGLPYPPHFAPFAAVVAIPSLSVSSILFVFINIAVSMALAFVVVETERRVCGSDSRDVGLNHFWAIALVLGSSGVWGVVWLGQISLLIALFVWVAFRFLDRCNTVLAGVLLAIVSVKPQMAALLFFWLLLHGQWKVLAVAAAAAGFLSAYAFAKVGLAPSITGWITALAAYQHYPENMLGSGTIMGLPSLVALYGVDIPLPVATAIGALALVYLRVFSKASPFAPMALGTILLVQMMVFSRPIDIAFILPVFALFWPSRHSHPIQLLFFVVMMALICFPQQVVARAFPFPEASHFRTLPVAVLTVLFFRQMLLGASRWEYWSATSRLQPRPDV
ncbi:hypothetical protein CYG48_17920 (plasmid) [Neorhizobium sp. SOG26]|uniref:DUF2029 domain-containing protein n=1 Tax=Neorhizobium turbinariae TaxID=2937795 RepID=A0ABT0IX51_9HYPH|nr:MULTISPECIES: glycosyltransferase family 87 protein [Neorhizobium]AXV17699.1 hypothetical protein CYG48_17920 [Neorhizobium sp. SOG26]MCK8782471.1 DUF2029 domain-containing protein [Neorhizobium turbinariae]